MNKRELVEKLATMTSLTQVDCKKFLKAFMDTVRDTLKNHGRIAMTEFGVFKVVKVKERMAMNPFTNQKILIPSRAMPKFKTSNALKKLVSQ